MHTIGGYSLTNQSKTRKNKNDHDSFDSDYEIADFRSQISIVKTRGYRLT